MTSAARQSHQPTGWRATCALLSPGPVADLPEPPRVDELEEALLRRGVDIVRCKGVHDALAQAMLHDRRRRSGEVSEPFIVVFVEPARTTEAPALVEIASTFAPRAVFWQFTREPTPRLTAWPDAASEPAPSRAADAASPAPRRTDAPALRLAVDDDLPPARARHGAPAAESDGVHHVVAPVASPTAPRPPSSPAASTSANVTPTHFVPSPTAAHTAAELTQAELAILLAHDHDPQHPSP
jgi:hypothetical protein